jgi:hypothetical protein
MPLGLNSGMASASNLRSLAGVERDRQIGTQYGNMIHKNKCDSERNKSLPVV